MGLLDTIGKVAGMVVNPVGALQDFSNSGILKEQPVALSGSTQGLLDRREQRANESPEQIKEELLAGTDQSTALADAQGRIQEQNRALGGPDHSAFTQAIQNKANAAYGRDLNQMQRSADVVAPVHSFNRTAGAQEALAGHLNIMNQQDAMIRQQHSAYEQNRNAMLNSILGGVGTFAGMKAAQTRPQQGGSASSTSASAAPDSIGPVYGGSDSVNTGGIA